MKRGKILAIAITIVMVLTLLVACVPVEEIDKCANGHTYVDGVCTVCGEKDPSYVPPVQVKSLTVNNAGVVDVGDNEIVTVNCGGVTLKGGDLTTLTIASSVGDGEVTLDGVKAKVVNVYGGGVNSIYVKGGSKIADVKIQRVGGNVRVVVEDNSSIEVTVVDDGCDDVILTGTFGNVEVASQSNTVSFVGATVTTIEVSAGSNRVQTDKDTLVDTVKISEKAEKALVSIEGEAKKVLTEAPKSQIEVKGKVEQVELSKSASQAKVSTVSGSTTVNVITKAAETQIIGYGKVESVEVGAGGDGAKIDVAGAEVKTDSTVKDVTSNGTTIEAGKTTTTSTIPPYTPPQIVTVEVSTFAELRAAVDNATLNSVIKLTADLTHDTYDWQTDDFAIKSKDRAHYFTIDLNGHILGCEIDIRGAYPTNAVENASVEFPYSINVKFINSMPATGHIGSTTGQNDYAFLILGYSNVRLELVGIKAYGNRGALYTNGEFNGATIIATDCEFYGLRDNNNAGAYLAGNHVYTFGNCYFNGNDGLYAKSGAYTFNDCIFVADGDYVDPSHYGNGFNVTGNALVLDCATGYGQRLTATIEDAAFVSENGYGIMMAKTAGTGLTAAFYDDCNVEVKGHIETKLNGKYAFAYVMEGGESNYSEDDADVTMVAVSSMTISEDVTIPEGYKVIIDSAAALTIASGKTLTVEGRIIDHGIIVNNGTIVMRGKIEGQIQMNTGSLLKTPFSASLIDIAGVGSGTFSVTNGSKFTLGATTSSKQGAMNITFDTGTATLNSNHIMTPNTSATIAEGATFVIPSGKTLYNYGAVKVDGTLTINGTINTYTDLTAGNLATVWGQPGVEVEFVDADKVANAGNIFGGGSINLGATAVVVLGGDLNANSFSVTSGAHVTVNTGSTVTIVKDSTVTIPSGVVFTNDGSIVVNGTLDLTNLAYGPTGLVANRDGTLRIGGTGTLYLLRAWHSITDPNTMRVITGESGATMIYDKVDPNVDVTFVHNGTAWAEQA